jgi:subtilisin family serine protease
MKRQIFAFLALAAALLPASAGAQEPRATMSPALAQIARQRTATIPQILRSPLGGSQGRHRLGGREALSLHLRTTASREELEALGVQVRTLRNGLATVNVLPENLAALADHPTVSSITLPRLIQPALSKSLPDTGIPQLRTLSNGTFTGATGAGVVVGVIDSGIDVDHPNFKDALGHTRIAFVLDQTTNLECTAATIDAGFCTELDQDGHGTHVAGTAAGNGAAPDENGTPYAHIGVAPESTIVFVKTSFYTDDIIDGMEYIFAKADQLGLPAVINLSLQMNLGAHDGTDPMEQAIDALIDAQAGRAAVVAAGNYRDEDVHGEVKVQQGSKVAGPTISVPTYTAQAGAGNDFIQISAYYPSTDSITVELVSPTGKTYSRALNVNDSCLGPVNEDDGSVVICNSTDSILGQSTTAREIFIEISDGVASKKPRNGSWKLNFTGVAVAGNGEVDSWMQSSLGGEFHAAAFSTLVDASETVTIPGTSRRGFTVGAHVTRLCWTDSNGDGWIYNDDAKLGDIAPFSGFGPSRDNRSKPEISGPGMGIIAPLSAAANGLPAYMIINDHYMLQQGTSMATPHVTGAVALLLQDDPAATFNTLRSRLLSSARDDAYTVQYNNPSVNYTFGAGKLDLGRWGAVDPYETNDVLSQAWKALSGQALNGYIERSADVDYFLLHGMQGGDTVNLTLDSLPQNYALALQARAVSLDQCNTGGAITKASSNQAGTASESIVYTAPTGIQPTLQGVAAYMRVTSSAGGTSSADSYQLKAILTRPETANVHNTTATAQPLPTFVEMKVTGAISGAEHDYYSFAISPGKTMVLSAPGRALTLRDANGTIITTEIGALTYAVAPGLRGAPDKIFYVSIAGGGIGSYTLNLKIQ